MHMNRFCLTFAALCLSATVSVPSSAGAEKDASPATAASSVRIGLVKPKVQMGNGDTSQASDTVRSMLSEFLSGPTMQVTLLQARLPGQFEEEARNAGCDYILTSEVIHHHGATGGVLGRALGNFGGYVPARNAITSMVLSGAVRTAADVAASIKAKDELQLEIRLQQPGASAPVLTKTVKGRAKSDGEDILTPLIEKVAIEVSGNVSKR
jgi:hypothetical protein